MSSDTASTVSPSAPEAMPDTTSTAVNDPPPTESDGSETSAERFRRGALRLRLHGYAIGVVVLGAILIALAASNTAQVKVNWLVGSSRVSLVWLVLVTAVVAWLLGLMASARFTWRTRAPKR